MTLAPCNSSPHGIYISYTLPFWPIREVRSILSRGISLGTIKGGLLYYFVTTPGEPPPFFELSVTTTPSSVFSLISFQDEFFLGILADNRIYFGQVGWILLTSSQRPGEAKKNACSDSLKTTDQLFSSKLALCVAVTEAYSFF